jgi:hypothetical protein
MGGDKLLNGLKSSQRLELVCREFVGKSLCEVIDPLAGIMDLVKILRKIKKYYYPFIPPLLHCILSSISKKYRSNLIHSFTQIFMVLFF